MKRIVIAIMLIVSSALSHAASFDCAKASTRIEKAICGDEHLSKLDSDLMMAYKAAQASSSDADKLKSEQKAWLQSSRNKCEDAECIRKSYEDRINALKPVEVSAPATQTTPETSVAQNESSSDVKQEEKPMDTVAAMPETTKAIEPEPTSGANPAGTVQLAHVSPDDRPTSIFSDIFTALAGIVAIAMFAGLVHPKWIFRKAENPKRWKIVLTLFPIGMLFGFVANSTMTDARKDFQQRLQAQQKEEKKQKQEKEEQEQARRASAAQGAKLYSYYKSMPGNEDRPGYNEQQFHRGELISVCNINGKPRGYYGWIEFSTLFIEGNRIKNAPIVHMYVFFVLGDKASGLQSGMWRGEQYKQQLIETMQETCD